MAIAYVAVSNAAAQSAGVTTPAGTAAVTPTTPGSAATEHRFIAVCAHSAVFGATPTFWVPIFKDQVVGSGAVAAGSGQRYLSAFYTSWSTIFAMPVFQLTSATQNSHSVAVVSFSKAATERWDIPTVSTNAEDFGTADTSYSATTAASFTTITGAMLIAATVCNDNVTMASPTISGGGGGLGAITERADGGTATGNDVALKVHTIPVTTGGAGTITIGGTLSAASQGGTVFIQQTVTTTTPSSTLVDTYATQDATKFNYFNTASVVSGQLSAPAVAAGGSAASSVVSYDLRGSSILIELPQKNQSVTGTSGCGLYVQRVPAPYTDGELFGFFIDGNTMNMREHAGSFDETSTTYSATDHRWLKLSATADAAVGVGTISWDTSPDGVVWTNRRSKTCGLELTAVYSVAYCENFGGDGTSPNTALFDNFNNAPTGSLTPRFRRPNYGALIQL